MARTELLASDEVSQSPTWQSQQVASDWFQPMTLWVEWPWHALGNTKRDRGWDSQNFRSNLSLKFFPIIISRLDRLDLVHCCKCSAAQSLFHPPAHVMHQGEDVHPPPLLAFCSTWVEGFQSLGLSPLSWRSEEQVTVWHIKAMCDWQWVCWNVTMLPAESNK